MITEKVFNPKLAPNHQVILDAASDMIVAFDRDYQIAYYNKSFKKTFNLFVNEPLEENKLLDSYVGISRFIELKSKWNNWLDKAFSGESFSEVIEYKIIGKKLIYHVEFTPIIRDSEIIYVQLCAREDTLRKNYEDLLKQKREIKVCTNYSETDEHDKEKIIQERDEALELLMENAERLQIIFDGSNDGFWDWNIEKDEIFHSKQYYEILGYRKGQLKTDLKTWEERIHPDDVDFVLESLHSHLEGKTDQFCCEYRALTKSGNWKWVLDKGKVAIRDKNNYPLRIAGVLSDIDERKETEKELKESEARFVSMAENLPVMVWLTDNRIKPTYINKKAIGYVGEFIEDSKLQDYLHEDDVDFFKYNLRQAIRTKEVLKCEIRLKNKQDEYRWILTNIVPRVSENGKFIGVLGVGLDITERKEIETKLLENETQFTEITSVIGDGIFMIDSDFNLQFANPEFSNLLGYNIEELKGKNIHDIIHNHNSDQDDICPFKKVFTTGEKIRVPEDYYINKNGDHLPVSHVVSPIKRNDEIVGCVVAFHDITDRLAAEEEMKRFVEELQFNKELMEENANEFARLNEMLGESESRLKELNASKDKFFSIISHDLRSPFTSITGFAEVMLEDMDTLSQDEIKDFTGSIYKSSKNIQNLLENLLQWSRVQTGRIEFNPINFDLTNLANDVIALYQVNAARKKIMLTNSLENEYYVKADKFMIDTVLRNLISNSIKFTKQGGAITIVSKELSDQKMLQISVEDTGVGMKEEVISKLFKIDEHFTTKGTDKEKGTGLGLILCKEFIEKNGGKIWAESTLGEGSQFKFLISYEG